MNINLGDDSALQWIQLAVSCLTTLIAVFIGAWLAFKVEEERQKIREANKNVSAINWTIFVLGTTANKLISIRTQIIDPVRDHPLRFLEIRPLLGDGFEFGKLPLNKLDFLLGTNHKNLLMMLYIEQEQVTAAILALRERSRLHLNELQPRLEAAGIKHGTTLDLEPTKKILGDLLFNKLNQLTEDVIQRIDNIIESHKKTIDDLNHAAKDIYPKSNFITIKFEK